MAGGILTTASGRVILDGHGGVAVNYSGQPAPRGTIPGIPVGFAIGAVTANSVALSWSAPTTGTTPLTGYIVIYSKSSSGPWTTYGDINGTSTVVGGLTAGTTYYFAVAAVNVAGTGTYASPISATTGSSIPILSSVSPTSGTAAGGTLLTLSGSNLSVATSVTAGGASVVFSIVNSTTITLTSPAHAAGGVGIVVGGPGGNSASVTYTYTPVAVSGSKPTWTSVNPWVASATAPTTITVTGSGFTGATVFDDTAGATVATTVVSDTQLRFVAQGDGRNYYPYTFHITNPAGDSESFGVIEGQTAAVTTINTIHGVVLAGAPMPIYGYAYPPGTAVFVEIKLWSDSSVISSTSTTASPSDGSWSVSMTAPPIGQAYFLHSYTAASGSDFWTGSFLTTSSLTAPLITDVEPAAKLPGNAATVTISGSDFTNAASIRFGSVTQSTFTVVNDSTITLVAPEQGFGLVNLTVTNTSGETSGAYPFQYLHALAEPVPQSVGGAAPVVSSRWKGPFAAVNSPKTGQVTSVTVDPAHGNTSGTGSDGISNNLWSTFDFLAPSFGPSSSYPLLADGGTVHIRAGTFRASFNARGHLADFPGGINIVGVGADQVTLLNIGTGPGGDKAMTLWQCNAYIYGINFMMDGVDMQTGGYAAIRFNSDTGTSGSAAAHYIHVEKCRFNQCQEAITSDTGWTVTGENWCLYINGCDFSPQIPNCYNSDILSHEVYSGAQQFWENCNSYGSKYGTNHKGRAPSMTIVNCWTRRTLNRWIDYPESGVFQAWNSTFTESTPQYTSPSDDTDMHLFEYCSSTPNLTVTPTSPLFNNCDLYFSRGVDVSDGAARGEDWMTPVPINFVNCRAHWNNQDGTTPRLIAVDPADFSTHNERIVGIPLTKPSAAAFETLPAAPAFRTP